jgi:curli biogenesis system outer membrane secretion channel CsgG
LPSSTAITAAAQACADDIVLDRKKEKFMNTRITMLEACAVAAATLLMVLGAGGAAAQPVFGNPSPTAGSETSQKANAAADQAIYKPVEYVNKSTRGPALIVIPGEIKSNNASFTQRFLPNNIADFAELELSQANFQVLERSNLGHLLQEISLAYNLGDPNKARQTMQVGQLKTTKYIIKFDILKAEQIAENKEGFDGRAVGGIIGMFGGLGSAVTGRATSSVQTSESSGVWLIGMRYKIMDANTTEQVAQGYQELKMEVGAASTSVLGVSQSAKGGVGLDTMVQRLVQTAVYEIDSKYKE